MLVVLVKRHCPISTFDFVRNQSLKCIKVLLPRSLDDE